MPWALSLGPSSSLSCPRVPEEPRHNCRVLLPLEWSRSFQRLHFHPTSREIHIFFAAKVFNGNRPGPLPLRNHRKTLRGVLPEDMLHMEGLPGAKQGPIKKGLGKDRIQIGFFGKLESPRLYPFIPTGMDKSSYPQESRPLRRLPPIEIGGPSSGDNHEGPSYRNTGEDRKAEAFNPGNP